MPQPLWASRSARRGSRLSGIGVRVVSQWRSEVRSGCATVRPASTQCGDQWGVLREATALATLPSLFISRGFMVRIASEGSGGSAGSLPTGHKRTSLAMDTTPAAANFYRGVRARPATCPRRHHAHCPRSVHQAYPKSHPHPTAHRQSHDQPTCPAAIAQPATSRRGSFTTYTPPLLTHGERFTSWTAPGTV